MNFNTIETSCRRLLSSSLSGSHWVGVAYQVGITDDDITPPVLISFVDDDSESYAGTNLYKGNLKVQLQIPVGNGSTQFKECVSDLDEWIAGYAVSGSYNTLCTALTTGSLVVKGVAMDNKVRTIQDDKFIYTLSMEVHGLNTSF